MNDAPEARTVVRMLQRIVETHPDSMAIHCGKEELTYRRLWAESGAVAARLQKTDGFRPGCLVGVLFERGVAGIVAQLGIWRAGAAYLPLDPALPDARIEALLLDSKPHTVLTQLGLERASITFVPQLTDVFAGTDATPEPAHSAKAYVIYTSGSTGTPKGVRIDHPALVNLLTWHQKAYGTGPGTRVAAFAGLGFDAAVWETWAALANGATLVLPAASTFPDIEEISQFLEHNAVEQCFLSTPLAEQLLGAASPPRFLRLLLTGGDRLRLHPPRDFPAAVHNHYGPTEATVVTTASRDLRAQSAEGAPAIGWPIAGARVRLVDADGVSISEPGQAGELLIGGTILASAYWNDPELTARKFVSDDTGERWYASGDICQWTVAGDLGFVGRRDAQLSVRGHRVEPAEIEQAILSVPEVTQAAVALRGDGADGSLSAFYCGAADQQVVQSVLVERLPRYMVPSVIQQLDTMPLTVNGKIDRASLLETLKAPGKQPSAGHRQESTEETIAEIWADLTGRRPAPHDNFFEIGGHSLLAAKMTSRIRDTFGVRVDLKLAFSHPVLSDFADRIEATLKSGG
ncbi:amino acid adenylation domain-containing protein [Streptomyces wuyuanensis]|uniref:non-ribosomal peptide synthetase n=1 Tax=Streptomyces wuyuanensis TaxID=1196353 RepID=UPI00371FA4C5